MECKMLEFFIYYIMAAQKEGTEDYSLNGCTKKIQIALEMIKSGRLTDWNNKVNADFLTGHPIIAIQDKLLTLSDIEYEKMLLKVEKKIKKYISYGAMFNYDSLYTICSEDDVRKLAFQIFLIDTSTSKIEQELEKISIEGEQNREIYKTNREKIEVLIYELGQRYYYGIDVEKDYAKAIEIWEIIEKDSRLARYMLACCHQYGKGVEKDVSKAYKMFNELINDDIRAKYKVALMNYKGEGIAQNYARAFELFNKLKGHIPYDLDKIISGYIGKMYYNGLGINKDKQKGFELLEDAWMNGFNLDYKDIKNVLMDYYSIKP